MFHARATTMSERQVPTAVAQRIVIRFLVWEGVKNTEIFLRLRNQFGSECLSRAAVFKWAKAFKDGRETVENEPHDRRPRTSITPDNIRRVEQIILEDRRMNVRDISAELGISIGSVESIIHEHLQYRKVTARWVPKLLNFEQKFTRWEVCRRLLTRYEAEGDDFLTRIFTTDETWVHYYTPESKVSSKEWRKKEEGAPVKAKTTRSAGKVMCTVFWDRRGVLYVDFLRTQRTINAVYYSNLLKTHVKPAYRSKRRSIPARSAILLQDNARPHTARLTLDTISELGWEVLEHPPYSPDLSPCDYHMFGPLKEALGGQRFNTDDEVEEFVRTWLSELPKEFFDTGIKKLTERWTKCVTSEGEYIEKL